MKETVRTSHLIYIIIIAIIVISYFLVIAFGGTETASITMGTASTVSSLILSVIAIVLSLIDVAGQKQSVIDLKETAEKLTETNTKSSKLLEDVVEKIEDITILRDQLLEEFKINQEWREEIRLSLQQVNTEKSPEENQKIIQEITKKLDTKPIKTNSDMSATIRVIQKDDTISSVINKIRDFIDTEYDPGENVIASHLVNRLQSELGISSKFIRKSIITLHNQGYLTQYGEGPHKYIVFNNYY